MILSLIIQVFWNRMQKYDSFPVRTVITRHINNVFKEGELEKEEVCANFAHTTRHGAIEGKQQTQEIVLYNLDVIISVGYRVKSKRGTASQSYDCKDKKIKSKKQVLRSTATLQVSTV